MKYFTHYNHERQLEDVITKYLEEESDRGRHYHRSRDLKAALKDAVNIIKKAGEEWMFEEERRIKAEAAFKEAGEYELSITDVENVWRVTHPLEVDAGVKLYPSGAWRCSVHPDDLTCPHILAVLKELPRQ